MPTNQPSTEATDAPHPLKKIVDEEHGTDTFTHASPSDVVEDVVPVLPDPMGASLAKEQVDGSTKISQRTNGTRDSDPGCQWGGPRVRS
ncbi:guanosine polyphosphate pyrophosphohydrolase/synthetase [Microbacterium testaceum StLB037]|uniref:Guanosine polyphosphate pyrophosphohydrolase/synthetase n=1 Tax=Microbacterium testaceum (strain StLB037) TaxID=979556 RepID=E8NDN5_MICTS|nr:guanosine polyphosphate pyrophosphohydrolase/synthetase [Microbacterium testaceum StLB037]